MCTVKTMSTSINVSVHNLVKLANRKCYTNFNSIYYELLLCFSLRHIIINYGIHESRRNALIYSLHFIFTPFLAEHSRIVLQSSAM